MAPDDKDMSGTETILLESKKVLLPNPSHEEHAPAGLLKEKIRGSSSSREKSQTGQANLDEKR